jgi:hypothetical protein
VATELLDPTLDEGFADGVRVQAEFGQAVAQQAGDVAKMGGADRGDRDCARRPQHNRRRQARQQQSLAVVRVQLDAMGAAVEEAPWQAEREAAIGAAVPRDRDVGARAASDKRDGAAAVDGHIEP